MKPVLPDAYPTIRDGALGATGSPTDNVSVKIGVASSGDQNAILTFTSLQQIKDTLVSGPLAEALAHQIAIAGGPVYAIRGTAATAGSNSAVTKVGTGTSVMTVTGTPLDAYQVTVKITRAGASLAAATAAFKFTTDGGDNWSEEVAVPSGGSYAVTGTGLTFVFAEGTFVVDDTYSFTSTAPAMTLTNLNGAFDVLLADPREWAWVHIVGEATATVAAGVATRMAEAEAEYRFAFAIMETRDRGSAETEDAWITAVMSTSEWGNFADTRVAVVPGHVELTSALTGKVMNRPFAWNVSARLGQLPVSQDAAEVELGPLKGIVSMKHDEYSKPGLDAEGFTTGRTFVGRTGFYVAQAKIKAPEGSDYGYIANRRVMDKACKISRDALLKYLNKRVRVDRTTGFILEKDAAAIEAYVKGQLQTQLVSPGDASDAIVLLNREDNILSTRSTTAKIRVLSLAYLSWLEYDIGFTNPALELA